MKVLYVLSYLSKNGGVQSVVNNYVNNFDKNKVQIDFLTLLPGDKEMEEALEKQGCNVYRIKGSEEKNLGLFIKEIKNFFKEHHDYDILHSHQTNLDIFYLREAKKWKIPVRIMHVHSTSCDISKLRMNILKIMSKVYANYYFACSEEAGKWMYGKSKKFYVVNNAIHVEKCIYNEAVREKVRKENHFEDSFVIGNVARMVEMKNHKFLIDVFEKIVKTKSNAKLLLIGDGPLKGELQDKVKQLNLQDKVIFYGVTDKVNELLQAMDVFVLPSLYEGVPLTVLEAAASGVKYIISDTINSHLASNDLELKLSLAEKPEVWAEKIIEFTKEYERKNQRKLLEDSGFDIEKEAKKLEEIYQNILQGEGKDAK